MEPSPLKIFIQDIFRASSTEEKYVYELFSTKFKNISIHGVVTQISSNGESAISFELSDPTGVVQVCYNPRTSNKSIQRGKFANLCTEFENLLSIGHSELPTLKFLKDKIVKTQEEADIYTGCFLHVIGDIFVDLTKGVRMVSAFECNLTSSEREVVWLTELQNLYEHFYLCQKDSERLPKMREVEE